MKAILIIIFCIFCLNSQSQNEIKEDTDIKFILPFKSKIVTNDLPCKGAVVNIYDGYSFNPKSDANKILQTIELDDDGILELEIPGNESYIIEVTKKGFIHKRFKINTDNVPKEQWSKKFAGFNVEAIELFKPIKGVNYKLFDFPLILIEFYVELDKFYYNESYSNLALKAIDAIKVKEARQILVSENEKLNIFDAEKDNLKTKMILLSISCLICIVVIIFLIFSKRK